MFDCNWVSQACSELASCWNGSELDVLPVVLAVELLEVELLAAVLSAVLVALGCCVAVVLAAEVWLAPVFDCNWVSQAWRSLASC
jgi:hypothetical protein